MTFWTWTRSKRRITHLLARSRSGSLLHLRWHYPRPILSIMTNSRREIWPQQHRTAATTTHSPPSRGGQRTVRGIASICPFSRLGTPSCCRAIRARTLLSARGLRLPGVWRCVGTACEAEFPGRGMGFTCRGGAAPTTGAGVTMTRSWPSRSRGPCLERTFPRPAQLSAHSPSMSDSFERTSSNERRSTGSGSGSSLGPGKVNGAAQSLLPPRGRLQSEVDRASSRRRRPRSSSYDEFGAKPRRSRFESMVNLGVALGSQRPDGTRCYRG
jgi:hypothetical protein